MLSRRHFLAATAATVAFPALPARAATPVRIGVIPILASAPLFIADRQGWLTEAGLQATFTTFESGPNMIQALASGTIDVYTAGVAPLGVARSKGIDIKVVAATAVEENVLVAGEKLASLIASSPSPAEAFMAFRADTGAAAKIATQPAGSVPNTTLQHWLNEVAKVAPADVEIVTMGIDATQQAILAGAVDGATLREPAVTLVTQRNPALKLVVQGGAMFPGQPGTVIGVMKPFIDANAAGTQALVAAVARAIDLIRTDPETVVPVLVESIGKGLLDAATIKAALASPATKFVADPRTIIAATSAMQDYQVKLGSLAEAVPLDGLFDTSFYEKLPPA